MSPNSIELGVPSTQWVEDTSPPTEVGMPWNRQGRLLKFGGTSEDLDLHLDFATDQPCDFEMTCPALGLQLFPPGEFEPAHPGWLPSLVLCADHV